MGEGPGSPAVGDGSVWVPNTSDGTVARIDPATRVVTATIAGLPPAPVEANCGPGLACGYVNAAAFSDGSLWVSCDSAGLVARIDGSTNRIVERVAVSPRPGGLAVGGGFVWVFHTLGSAVTRIEPSSGSAREFTVPGAQGAGIAYTSGSLWLLDNDQPAVLRLDPDALAVTARVPLEPFGVRHPFRKAWSLAAGDRSLWAANPNYDMATEVDAATASVENHVRLPRDQPFGVALGGRDVWVAARTGIVRIDAARGAVRGDLILPTAGDGYTGVAYGFGAAWVTNYDRDTLTPVRPYRVTAVFSARLAAR